MRFTHAVQCAVLVVLAVPMFGQVTVTEPIPSVATIDVDASKVASQAIPRTIFGTFLEQLRHPCQKHPLTKTASFAFAKKKSGVPTILFGCLHQPLID